MQPAHATRRGPGLLLMGLLGLILTTAAGCGEPIDAPSRSGGKDQVERARPGQLEILFPYGSEKKAWLTEVTRVFNQQGHKSTSGKPIHVTAIPMGSGESIRQILDEELKAHIVSPASLAFIRLGNAKSQAKTNEDLVGNTQELVLSPVVIAMWKPMAEAIGWGKKAVGWKEILELARSDEGWARYGMPQWGKFRFGHTHPEFSNSGLISLFAEVYAATGKQRGLTIADVQKPETATFLRDIERSVVHYGSSTGFFGRKLFGNGPAYLSAAVLYENMVIESYDRLKYPDMPFPVVAIYPKEGTFWSDHPVGLVNRSWVTEEHKDAATRYIEFLLETTQQRRAMHFGFRPADLQVTIESPIDTAHGVDPQQPKTLLEVPTVDVMDAINRLWHENKKRAEILLVLDTSGSMKGEPMRKAKEGALAMLEMLEEDDRVGLMSFNENATQIVPLGRVGDVRERVRQRVNGLFAKGGTALYHAVQQGYAYLQKLQDQERISAIVVLTDGRDEHSKAHGISQASLLPRIRYDNEGQTLRVFTIAYGQNADAKALEVIAKATQAKAWKGTTKSIREIFRQISTFF